VASNLEAAMQSIVTNGQKVHRSGFFTHLVDIVEDFLDAGDAVRRRRRANKIYKDLRYERISQTRAVAELQALNNRQKGGWLAKKIQSIQFKRMSKS
jgi:hypothetical protein